MSAKLFTVIVIMGAAALTLLLIRQLRIEASARSARLYQQLVESEHAEWKLQGEIAARTTDARSVTYTIKPGESLSEIAQRLLNSAARWEQLYELNRHVLSDPDEIRAGTVITIPEPDSGFGVRGSGKRRAHTPEP